MPEHDDDHEPEGSGDTEAPEEVLAESTPDSAEPDAGGSTTTTGQFPCDPADAKEPEDRDDDGPVRTINRAVLGQLVLHYESRDVTVVLDGDAGLRVMTTFANRKDERWADTLHPEESWALSGWLVLDLQEPLAMSWLPGLPARVPRTTVDPAPAA